MLQCGFSNGLLANVCDWPPDRDIGLFFYKTSTFPPQLAAFFLQNSLHPAAKMDYPHKIEWGNLLLTISICIFFYMKHIYLYRCVYMS